jgi:hypothetical protein
MSSCLFNRGIVGRLFYELLSLQIQGRGIAVQTMFYELSPLQSVERHNRNSLQIVL